jgi:hypothetical protein
MEGHHLPAVIALNIYLRKTPIVGQYSLVQCALPLQAAGNRPGHVQSEKFCKAFAAEHLCRRRCAVTLSWSNYTSIIEVYRSKWQLL